MFRRVLLALLIPYALNGREGVVNQRQNYFLTQTDYSIHPKVNPITGEYSEEEVDLIVAGAEPLSVRRFYNSSAPYDPRYASWRYNPECFFVANFELGSQEIFVEVHYPGGSSEYFTYSSTGTKATHTNQHGAVTYYTYDIFDHLIETKTFASGRLLKTTSATWTPFHKLSETIDDLTVTYTYDPAGRKIKERQATCETSYTYDALGRVASTQMEALR